MSFPKIKLYSNEKLYSKDPETSELGNKIVKIGIELINELGFEKFTFKKLSLKIESPESSIYRYFKNKHQFLLYLVNWYWSWIDYKIVLKITNIQSDKEQLKRAIQVISNPVFEDYSFGYLNENLLNNIIVEESVKAFHTKDIDAKNEKGLFDSYKTVINRLANTILRINSKYKFPHTLITTIIDGSLQQRYYKKHLPALVDSSDSKNLTDFYTDLVLKTILC